MIVAAGCGLIGTCLGLGINISGLFFSAIADEFQTGMAEVSASLTICNLVHAFVGMSAPFFLKRFSLKKRLAVGNFAVVDTMKIANNKFLAIVKAGKDNYYLIGVGKDEITFLDKLDKDDISFKSDSGSMIPGKNPDFGRFKEMFMKYAGRGKDNTDD